MPDLPFTVTEKDPEKRLQQILLMVSELYQDRIGGANLGDVFTIGDDDILTLSVTSDGGLQKIGNYLSTKRKSGYGIDADSAGLKLKRQAHETDAVAVSAITLGAGAGTVDIATFNTALTALVTEINAIKDKHNALLVKLETSEILADS